MPLSDADQLPDDDACRLLRELREQPQLLDRIAAFSGNELQLQKTLRAEFPADVVAAAVTLHELRLRARDKFTLADRMWFDRKGLEQSTPEEVARHKAQRFEGRVYDYCCGIGADAIAQAERCEVVAVDREPAACLRTLWNAEVYGRAERVHVVCDDVVQRQDADGLVHIDPDRRPGRGGRVVRLEDAEPGLPFLQELMTRVRGGAVKMSPAANFAGRFPAGEIELISLRGECKEATLWFGDLGQPGLWRATVLPQGETLAGNPLDAWSEITPPQRFIYDPDPAIVRAGLVDLLAEQLGLSRLDDAEEYLTGDTLVASPFVRSFELLEEFPNNDKELRRYFRQSEFGQLEIKCRHIRVPIEQLRRKLTLPGSEAGVLIVARLEGKARGLVCRRVD